MKKIEINGVMVEFDEKMLVKQEIKVGDNVQIIKKEYSSPKLYAGVVTQIIPYKETGAVEVLYIEDSYSDFKIKHELIVPEDNETVIVKMEDRFLPFTKDRAIEMLEKNINSKENELQQAKLKLEYFMKYFNNYFTLKDGE